jgi:hypothetical protein
VVTALVMSTAALRFFCLVPEFGVDLLLKGRFLPALASSARSAVFGSDGGAGVWLYFRSGLGGVLSSRSSNPGPSSMYFTGDDVAASLQIARWVSISNASHFHLLYERYLIQTRRVPPKAITPGECRISRDCLSLRICSPYDHIAVSESV